ncbi:MAG: RluA family pseudouridine synthase [Candidatus Omnitrophica bacterium]|nr:RluA family pseudouridine synthase [Candidatus Omnitrophota bacterium]
MHSGHPQRIIPVLYEDESYIVFDKPAGVLVIPAPGEKKQTLVDIVNRQYAPAQGWKLHPCHRLDRETSGAIIFAKGKGHQQAMMALFHRQAVSKRYIAFVHGKLPHHQGELRSAIRDLDQVKFRRGASAKPSVTRYKVIEERKSFSIVEVTPVTGRTNQIRIQFAQIGHPLVGERKYARGKDYQLQFRRVALHAHALGWEHPVSHKRINVTAELHQDMEGFIARNGN